MNSFIFIYEFIYYESFFLSTIHTCLTWLIVPTKRVVFQETMWTTITWIWLLVFVVLIHLMINMDKMTVSLNMSLINYLLFSTNLQVLSEQLNFWSSKFVVTEGDVMIDISLAAKGMSSSVPVGAQQQMLPYPGTFYRFDPCIFHGQNTELDLD